MQFEKTTLFPTPLSFDDFYLIFIANYFITILFQYSSILHHGLNCEFFIFNWVAITFVDIENCYLTKQNSSYKPVYYILKS